MPRTKKTLKKKKKRKGKKKEVGVISGARKKSVARAIIKPGTGRVLINKKPLDTFNTFHLLILSEPLIIAEQVIKGKIKEIDIMVNVRGGGVESQVDAARLSIARALVAFTKSQDLRNAFLRYDRMLLVADIRQKEKRKPGDSKARAKRQKSYR